MSSDAANELAREAEPVATPDSGVQVLDLFILLANRRRFIFGFTFCAVILVAILVFTLPSKYTATTLILPPAQNSSISSALLGQMGASGALASAAGATLGIKNTGEMYVSLFRTQTVEEAVIQRFGLSARYSTKRMSDTRRVFETRSSVSLGLKDGLITITVTDRDPKVAADIANGYVEEFRKLTESLAVTEAAQRRVFFQQQLLEANDGLVKAEDALKHTQQSTGVLQIDSQAKALIESAATLRAQVAAKEVQLSAMRSYATEDNPQMMLAEQQLAALKGQLAKLSGKEDQANPDILVPGQNIPEAGMEYLRAARDVKYYAEIVELIAKQLEMAKLDEARQGAIVQVADLAVPPDKRSSPKRMISVLLAGVFGFVFAVLWVIVSGAHAKARRNPRYSERLDTLRASFLKKP